MSLYIDLIMFKGVGEANSNLAPWRGEKPTPVQLKALQAYLDENNKGDTYEESEFI